MKKVLDMQFIRYINLFGKITRVQAKHCFAYNNMLIYVVAQHDVAQAIGQNSINLEKISRILNKRIRIVAQPKLNSRQEIEEFIRTIICPVKFSGLEINGQEAVITAGRENKAQLIGRQRARQEELQDILEQYFGIKKVTII